MAPLSPTKKEKAAALLKDADSPSNKKESPYISAFQATLIEENDSSTPTRGLTKKMSTEKKETTPKDIAILDPKQLDIN